jgi:hypothetical protein
LRRAPRAAFAFAAALALVATPLLAWFAANGALSAMVHDIVAYPSYIVAGYAKLPFPSLAANLPLPSASPRTSDALFVRLGYLAPALCLGGLLLCLPVSALDPRRPAASLAEAWRALRGDPRRSFASAVTLFGLLGFRTALGRSDIWHVVPVVPVAALLLLLACERTAALWRAAASARVLAAERAAALALLLVHSGLLLWPTPLANLMHSARAIRALPRELLPPREEAQVVRVARWIREHTAEGEAVLFLPNDAAAYYLADRPNPIRFVMGHQIVTEAHRAEVLAAMRARPPRYVVWNDGAVRVDDLPDPLVFGAPLLGWISENYVLEQRIGRAKVLRWRGATAAGPG